VATFEDAEAARKAHQDRLAALGAHAIEIQMLDDLSGYQLIVHFAEPPASSVPSSLVTTTAGKTCTVPLRTVTKAA
jgi:hypothetical protein